MLLYIKNTAYKEHTLVEIFTPTDTIARVRAVILHRLYEMGHSHHQFRLKHDDTYLRDAYTLEEYRILNNTVVHIVPLDEIEKWKINMMFHDSTESYQTEDDVQLLLKKEVKFLDKREHLVELYKVLLMIQSLMVLLAGFTNYWYFCFVYLLMVSASICFCPVFSRVGGWVGKNSFRKKEYVLSMVVMFSFGLIACLTLFGLSVSQINSSEYPTVSCIDVTANCFIEAQTDIQKENCNLLQKRCYQSHIFSCVYFVLASIFMGASLAASLYLARNLKFKLGDYIEKHLTKSRDLDSLLEIAKHGGLLKKRSAVFEIATMAASSYENKLNIVEKNGFEVLLSLSFFDDLTVQEYTLEAIAECLSHDNFHQNFVNVGGLKSLTAVLNSDNRKVFHHAINALYYLLTSKNFENNESSCLDFDSLEDICRACRRVEVGDDCQLLSTVLLELSTFDNTRSILVSMNSSMESLVEMLETVAKFTKDTSFKFELTLLNILQTIELLVVELPSLITSQESLHILLLKVPSWTSNQKICLFSTKLLNIFVENFEGKKKLVCSDDIDIVSYLYDFVHIADNDVFIMRSIASLCYEITLFYKSREKLIDLGLVDFLQMLQSSCSDKKVWSTAENCKENLQNGDPTKKEHDDNKNFVKSEVSSALASN